MSLTLRKRSTEMKPGTDSSALDPVLEHVDMVLVMTVEPGFGGQDFMEDMLENLIVGYLKAAKGIPEEIKSIGVEIQL